MQIEKVEINNSNGIIRGQLTLPISEARGCLICLHGGPGGDQHGNTEGFDQIAEMAASIGLATLQFSFFGNGESDGSPVDYSIASQKVDYGSVVAYVKSRFDLPIHVVGESAGATVASIDWLDEIASYIFLWPAFDLLDTDLRPYLSYSALTELKAVEVVEHDGVKLGREFVYEILTTDFSSSFQLPDKPIFLAHGQGDEEVPYSQSLRALKNTKSKLMFLSHPTADHGFKDPTAREFLLENLKSWLAAQV